MRSCWLAILLALSLEAQQQPWILPEGTPVRLRINRTVSSAEAQQGENIDFETLDDVILNDRVVIPKGSIAMATVTEAVPKRRMARGGKLAMNIDYVRLVTQERLALRGVQDVKGGGHTGAMTGAMVASAIVFFPAAPFFLFMKGKDISIPKGHEVTVYTNTQYNVDPAKFPAAPPGSAPAVVTAPVTPAADFAPVTPPPAPAAPPATAGAKAMTNDDVLKLKQAGLSDDLIVAKIKSSPPGFKLDTDDLVALKKGGVSDAVIGAMMNAMAGSARQ